MTDADERGGIVEFSDAAREQIRGFIEEDEGTDIAVRVRVRDPSPVAPVYEMALIEPDEREPGDETFDGGGFDVVVDGESARILEGTTVDWVDSIHGSGFQFDNPSIRPLGTEPLTGPLAERVQHVLDERINPGIATHGGAVSLVDIRDDIVYLRMSGGCQGCGMASVTLSQGIKQVLQEAVPEIVEVRDVTDHAAGTNPYFSPEK
jgi:Fe/S biogenesis protein NfuA